MRSISVVIITRNEEKNIVDCIRSAKLVADDIVVVDCGSEDYTVPLAQAEGARTFVIDWKGFGYSRNFGALKAKHDWILALDADERVSWELAHTIKKLSFDSEDLVFKFSRKNYIGDHAIRFGTLGFERVKRIYHRNHCSWDLTLVHEKLVSVRPVRTRQIKGSITHYGLKSFEDYHHKAVLYAQMSAEKYFLEQRKAGWLKRVSSPVFNSFKSYFFQFGFLEGKQGFLLAKTIGYYSWLKYYYLHQIHKQQPQTKELKTSLQPAKTA